MKICQKLNIQAIKKICQKLIFPVILIALIWVLHLTDFIALEIQNTVIYPVAECIINNYIIVFFLLLIMSVSGIFFKNKLSYYRVFANIEMILCYLCMFSVVATQNIPFGTKYMLVRLTIFSVSFIITYMLVDEFKEETQNQKQNVLNPILQYKDLYTERRYQANNLINIISDEENNYGYSICISAKWGSGKTSFINCVLNKLAINYDSKKTEFSIAEIRINAMELDNLSSLINYLFDRIKDILKESNIYVGINSEYQDLISSIVGTITTETAMDIIKSKLSSNSDYRENLSNLNQLILTHLENKKIVIVVDDIERCTKEKAVEFILFIKEIAMLNRCIIIFLTDYDELKKRTELEDDFLEKFFNYKMNLHSVSSQEILHKSIKDKEFLELINSSKMIFANNIEKAKNQSYLYIKYDNRQQYKEERVSQEQKNYELFAEKIQNPRQLIKAYTKYKELLKLADKDTNMQNELYKDFTKKVNYKKQIFIISLLYGFDIKQYELIEDAGIESYFRKFDFLYKKKLSENDCEDSVIDILAYEEWSGYYNSYITNEKLRFLSCLLSTPDELTKIATGFTSLQEEYIASIKDNIRPNGVSLLDVLKETINAKFPSDSNKKDYLLQTINLYKNEMNFDDAVMVLTDNRLFHYIQNDNFILEIFYNDFKDTKLINRQKCLDEFVSFAEHYTYYRLNDITRYISFLGDYSPDYSYLNESVFNKKSCSMMIEKYYERVVKELELNLEKPTSAISCLKALCRETDSYCKKNNISNLDDIKILSDRANKTVECIDYLLKFEQCLNSEENIDIHELSNERSYLQKLQSALELISTTAEGEIHIYWQEINSLIFEIANSDIDISAEEIEKIDEIILAYNTKYGEPMASWRRMYIEIKNKFQNSTT